jgi:hypothetical protein
VLWLIWDCEGNGCNDAVAAILKSHNISMISDCSELSTMTVAMATEKGSLATGGSFLAVTGSGGSNGVACAEGNYDPTIACSGSPAHHHLSIATMWL